MKTIKEIKDHFSKDEIKILIEQINLWKYKYSKR